MERILIVEDDMTLVALIKAMLKQHANPERQVLLAQNVKEANHHKSSTKIIMPTNQKIVSYSQKQK